MCSEKGCGKAFFKKSNLQDHGFSHLPMYTRPYACTLCEKKFISLDRLRRHELTHTERYKCQRAGCGRTFGSQISLRHHLDVFHDRVLNCDVCNKVFQLRRLVKEHRIKKHSAVPAYACVVGGCYAVFSNQNSLLAHVDSKHPDLVCELCNERFTGFRALSIHMSVHHNEDRVCSVDIGYNAHKSSFVQKNERFEVFSLSQELLGVLSAEDAVVSLKDPAARDTVTDPSSDPAASKDAESSNSTALVRYLAKSENPSYQSLTRRMGYVAEVVCDDLEPHRRRGRPSTIKSLPLPSSGASIINMVTKGVAKEYLCPYKSCQRKYVRKHAYDKHLKQHLNHIECGGEAAS